MKTNKEIITQIIDDLDLTYPASGKLNKDSLIECWSEYRKEPDYKFYGYADASSTTRPYKKIFKDVQGKKRGESWKNYILRLHGYKYCSKGHNLLTLDNFGVNKATASCIHNICRKCESIFYIENKEKILERCKNYRNNNKDKEKARHRLYQKNNKDKISATTAKRRAAKLERIPCWSSEEDEQKIKDLYKEAKRLEALSGIKYHVDHVIPLQGECVSGLHVPDNLQIISASENQRKGNKYIV